MKEHERQPQKTQQHLRILRAKTAETKGSRPLIQNLLYLKRNETCSMKKLSNLKKYFIKLIAPNKAEGKKAAQTRVRNLAVVKTFRN